MYRVRTKTQRKIEQHQIKIIWNLIKSKQNICFSNLFFCCPFNQQFVLQYKVPMALDVSRAEFSSGFCWSAFFSPADRLRVVGRHVGRGEESSTMADFAVPPVLICAV